MGKSVKRETGCRAHIAYSHEKAGIRNLNELDQLIREGAKPSNGSKKFMNDGLRKLMGQLENGVVYYASETELPAVGKDASPVRLLEIMLVDNQKTYVWTVCRKLGMKYRWEAVYEFPRRAIASFVLSAYDIATLVTVL